MFPSNPRMIAILALTFSFGVPAVNAQKMYWPDVSTGKIQRANLDGSDVEDVVTGLNAPFGVALDVPGGKVYWPGSSSGKIQRANLDGSNVEDLVTGLDLPFGIALDVAGGKMYWPIVAASPKLQSGKIQRANLDGSNVEDLVTGLGDPFDVALDLAGGKMYWVAGSTGKIQRADLNGSNVEDLLTGLGVPIGIALDVPGGKMYWTAGGGIHRANLDGSGVVDDLVEGLLRPWDVALDLGGGKMYWPDTNTDKIQRADLDGTNVEDLVTGVTGLAGITLDLSTPPENIPTVSEWGLGAMTLLVLAVGTVIFARQLQGIRGVNTRWHEMLDAEADIIASQPPGPTMRSGIK